MLASTTSKPLADRRLQERAGLVARHVHDRPGARPRGAAITDERLRRRRLVAAERGEQRAGILVARQAEQARPRKSARVEDVAGPIEQSDDAHVVALATVGGNLIRQRASDAAESEQHDIGVRLDSGRPPPIFDN